jgi:crossover junction endodeoxyribonuclease RuvC
MLVLATDPGLSGAVVLIGHDHLSVKRDFKLWEDIADAITEMGPEAQAGVIELVHSMPGQGVSSMFSFGKSAGVALGAYRSAGFSIRESRMKPLIEVTPQRWQAYYWDLLGAPTGKGARKNFDSVVVARLFRPDSAQYLTRVKDHNTADAILIGLWKLKNPDATTSIRAKEKNLKVK